jgi:putative aminopeptidase FrvX
MILKQPSRWLAPALLSLTLVAPAFAVTLDQEVEAFLQVPAVVGREEPAAELVAGRLAGLPVQRDALGNVSVTVGSGSPRRLVACPLGEPGYIVSRILDNGYLRLVPAGFNSGGQLWDQAHQGQTVVIGSSRGWVPGAVVLPSVHLMQGPASAPPEKPFSVEQAWVDVGAESAAEVQALGIRLLDAVALIRRPSHMAGGLIAGPSSRLKGACMAMVETARRLHSAPGKGTTVFAWTTLDLLNGKGIEYLVRKAGPFDEALLMSAGFGWKLENDNFLPVSLPPPGSGLLGAGDLPPGFPTQTADHVALTSDPSYGQPPWGKARVGYLGLPALYRGTPVETIALADVGHLTDMLETTLAGRKPDSKKSSAAPALPPQPSIVETTTGHEDEAALLSTLVSRYGVSGAEGPVREEILRQLPSWAKPEVDDKGNVVLTIGQGKEHVLLVAHMDEVGFRVKEILPGGRLSLEQRGGVLQPVWEAQAALVHGERGPVPGVFEPREGWITADKYAAEGPLTAFLGVSSAKELEGLGIRVGSTVTMPKRMFRIGPHRVLARGFDDRVGCTALLLAVRQIDPAKVDRLGHRVTFSWAVEEELGLVGSSVLAKRFPDLDRVHPVDTFVSSDSPIETGRFAWTPLGKGAVLRAMDNSDQTPRALIDRFLDLGTRLGIPLQVGMTGGVSDGLAFTGNGPEMLPFSWPGRHSHSPVEVADLRDVESLVRLILAAVQE